jgi:hypothetical protein
VKIAFLTSGFHTKLIGQLSMKLKLHIFLFRKTLNVYIPKMTCGISHANLSNIFKRERNIRKLPMKVIVETHRGHNIFVMYIYI